MMPGRTISQYTITEKLGGGGMGVVYKAHDNRLDRPVALKFLPPHLSQDPEANERFIREAKAASALDHPNICTIYDIGEDDDGRLFIVMAYYEGETLKYRLADGLSIDESVEIALQVAEGLERAHEAGIVHRDVKPANLMVTDRGRVKILDFGVAKLSEGEELTTAGSTVGTTPYMSPEQAQGAAVDGRTDIWALGVVLYEMLTGRRPFQGNYRQEILYAVMHQDPEPVQVLRPEVPEALAAVVHRMLEKEPSARYANAAALLEALEALAPASRRRGVPVGEQTPTAKQRPGWVVVAAIGAVMLLVGAFVFWRALNRTSPSGEEQSPAATRAAIAVLPFSVGGSELAHLEQSMVDLLSLKIDGAGSLRGIDPNALLGFLGKDSGPVRDPRRGQEVAAHFGAGHFILGSVTKLGDEIQLNATLYDAAGAAQQTAEATAEGENELSTAIDDLARQLIAGRFLEPGQELKSVAALTTASLPALKDYLEGEQLVREGRYQEAVPMLRRAVAEDSTFALAWYRLGVTIGWTDESREGIPEAIEKAARYSEGLPDPARAIILAENAERIGRYPEAERIALQVTRSFPENAEAWRQLGELRWHNNNFYGRSRSESREPFERALAFDPNNQEAMSHLIELTLFENRLEDADSLLARVAMDADDGPLYHALYALATGTDEEREQIVADLQQAGPRIIGELTVNAVKEGERDIPMRLRLADLLTTPERVPETQEWGYFVKGVYEGARGRWQASEAANAMAFPEGVEIVLRAYGHALPFYPFPKEALKTVREEVARWDTLQAPLDLRMPLLGRFFMGVHAEIKAYLVGLLSVRLQDGAALRGAMNTLSGIAGAKGVHSLAHSFLRSLEAMQAWQQDNPEAVHEALDDIRLANARDGLQFYGQFIQRYVRAETLYEQGRYEEALRWYDTFSSTGVTFLGPSYLRRAQIYEHLEDPENAIKYYTLFLNLWQDADPFLQPEVAQARQRLDHLLGNTVQEPNDVARPGR